MSERTRRGFLAGTGAAAVALAGCLGGGDESDAAEAVERPVRGPESASVTVTVFEDFACPHCRDFNARVKPRVVEEYVDPGDVRYVHADFPIPVDDVWSYGIASAARAVFAEAGDDAFWTFADRMFESQGNYSYDLVADVADEVADVGDAARTAAVEVTYREEIDADREQGRAWGVRGTPSVFVDGESVDGGYESISTAIQQQL